MKTRKIIAILALVLCANPSFSQEGFFTTHPSDGNNFASSIVIETGDGDFIVAVNDDLMGSGYSGCAKLFKISAAGEVLGSVTVDEQDMFCYLTNIFRHPTNSSIFVGTGLYVFQDESTLRSLAYPYLVQFDDQLNITLRKQVEWPDEYKGTSAGRPHTLLDSSRNLFGEYVICTPGSPSHDYRRLFTEMTLDGDFIRIVEDTLDLVPTGCNAEAVFELASTKQIGTFRNGYVEEGNPNAGKTHKLFLLNTNYTSTQVNEMNRFGDDTLSYNDYLVSVRYNMLEQFDSDIIPLNDTSLLFSMGAT